MSGADERRRTATLRVSQIPLSGVASELLDYFDSTVGHTFACKISSHTHPTLRSKGFGHVQFETPDAADHALRLHSAFLLPPFLGARLHLSPSFEDVIPRAVEPGRRINGAVVYVGYLSKEGQMEVLESWVGARVEFMFERKKIEIFVDVGVACYKMEIMVRDICASFGCWLTGVEEDAILLKLRYTPRLYGRKPATSEPLFTSRSDHQRFFVCKENTKCAWIRTADFSTGCSIGQSSYYCVELPKGTSASEITGGLPFYEELGDLNITLRDPFLSTSKIVPIISCPHNYEIPYEIVFQLNSLLHSQKISFGQIDDDFFSTLSYLSIDIAKKVLLKMHKFTSTCYDPVGFIKLQVENMRANSNGCLRSNASTLSGNLMRCHRMLITPSRVYMLGPEIEPSNYVVMHHASHSSDFLRVSFVDEDWSKLPSDAVSTKMGGSIFSQSYRTAIYTRILSILEDGLSIGSKHFEFLAFSASQLRSNSIWMFASSESLTAEKIREWMGNFKKIRSVSKCAARMGQLFSSSLQTFNVCPQDLHIIPDVEVTIDGIKYCFSDGIGTISAAFATQVAKRCGLKETPSAFQIRFGGYKGVVAVDRSSFCKISLRPSMLKFDSDNTMLCITKWSKSMPCYLNREIISLLSTLGVPDEAFEALQQEQLRLLEEVFTKKEAALSFLDSMGVGGTKTSMKMLTHGYEPISEPYLLMVLKAYCEYHLADVKSKCRIFVPKGRVLLGCLDETGNLSYGQVYVRVTMAKYESQEDQVFLEKVDDKTTVITGKVIVTKNPCLHPGDIRVLEAVNDSDLEETGLVDCIVFPQKGERPHPNECSGGDLDGDLYFVCWDENLIPIKADTPMDYVGRRPRIMDHDVKLQEIHNFFAHYMINDSLGAISTAHLVHADREPGKARSSKCLQLAKLHSMAVDFAKTGAPAEMPKVLRPKEYPDFMERTEKPMYISTGVFGKLYRMTLNSLEGHSLIKRQMELPMDSYDSDLEVKDFELYLQIAEEYKSEYAERFSALMNYYGAQSEDEILTGNLRNRSTYLEKDRGRYGEVKDRILVGFVALQKEVMVWPRSCSDEKAYQKIASACYHVTYHPKYRSVTTFLSFPWTFADVLLPIKSSKLVSRDIPSDAI